MRVCAAGRLAATNVPSASLLPVDFSSVVVDTFCTPPSLSTTWAISTPSSRPATLAA